jgi:hypothetical protein
MKEKENMSVPLVTTLDNYLLKKFQVKKCLVKTLEKPL